MNEPAPLPHMNSEFNRSITVGDWCALLGVAPAALSKRCIEHIQTTQSDYRVLSPSEREAHVIHILKRLSSRGIARTTQENIAAFESGWDENVRLCETHGVSAETLKPKYVKEHGCIRYQRDYIAPLNPFLANALLEIAAGYYFKKYLDSTKSVYEYGCGTGRFVFQLSELYPEKPLVGLDWTRSSQKLLGLIGATGKPVSGLRFDMLAPDQNIKLDSGTGVVTIGALEQLGDRFGPFLDYLLSNRPEIVVHLEPIEDFYGDDTLCDCMGSLYHRQRKYLSGYLPALQALQQEGRIQIFESRRLCFGDPYHESSSCIVWKPLKTE